MKKQQVWNLNKCFYGVKRNCRQVHKFKCIVLKLDHTFIFQTLSNSSHEVRRRDETNRVGCVRLRFLSIFYILFRLRLHLVRFLLHAMPHSKHSCVTWPFFRSHFRILLSTFLLVSARCVLHLCALSSNFFRAGILFDFCMKIPNK